MVTAPDPELAELAKRLLERRLYKSIDVRSFGHYDGLQRREARRIDRAFEVQIKAGRIIKDEGASISIYTQIGGDDERAHKRLHILDAKEGPIEITKVSTMIDSLGEAKKFTRYYFENAVERDAARLKAGETK
jgi:hypothetical protein